MKAIIDYDKLSAAEEKLINKLTEEMVAFYERATKLTIPESMTVVSVFKTMCQLSSSHSAKDCHALRELIKITDKRILQYWVISILAKNGDKRAVDYLLNEYEGSKNYAVQGYAWGGHWAILSCFGGNIGWSYKVEGAALGRHILIVNQYITDLSQEDSRKCDSENEFVEFALRGYIRGGHIENIDDTLELITLTIVKNLKEAIGNELKKKIPAIDLDLIFLRSRELAFIIDNAGIIYSKALKILNHVETEKSETNSSSSVLKSHGLFNNVVKSKLNIYEKHAIEQLGLTAHMLLSWKNNKRERVFDKIHFDVLEYLIKKADPCLTPAEAIQEIQCLNPIQSRALFELYPRGLRGEQLRNSYISTYSKSTLEELLRRCFEDKNADPTQELESIISKQG